MIISYIYHFFIKHNFDCVQILYFTVLATTKYNKRTIVYYKMTNLSEFYIIILNVLNKWWQNVCLLIYNYMYNKTEWHWLNNTVALTIIFKIPKQIASCKLTTQMLVSVI